MILLDEILSKFEVGKNSTMTHGDCKILMREAIRQALELAANEANMIGKPEKGKQPYEISKWVGQDRISGSDFWWEVNKESITEIINKVV